MTSNPDTNYRTLAGDANLFGAAFFGHKASKAQRAKLRRLWVKSCKEAIKQGNTSIKMDGNKILN